MSEVAAAFWTEVKTTNSIMKVSWLFLYISFHFGGFVFGEIWFFFFYYLFNFFLKKIYFREDVCLWTFVNDIFGFLGNILAEERTINLHTHISTIQKETVRPPKPGKESEIKMTVPFFLQLTLLRILNKKSDKWKYLDWHSERRCSIIKMDSTLLCSLQCLH